MIGYVRISRRVYGIFLGRRIISWDEEAARFLDIQSKSMRLGLPRVRARDHDEERIHYANVKIDGTNGNENYIALYPPTQQWP